MAKRWNSEELLKMVRSFQPACVLIAAADLDVFNSLYEKPMTAQALAAVLNVDSRAVAILLDALVAMELLMKRDNLYIAPDEIADLLVETSPENILPMVRHLGNCLRRWGQLAESKARDRCLELASIQDGQAVLEVAVGTGLAFEKILQANPTGRNEGIDLTEEMLNQAKAKAKHSGAKNYRLRVGDAYNLDYSDNSFEVVINNYMFVSIT